MLQLLVNWAVRTKELWIPRLRLNKMACESCALMAAYATWTVSGDGESRYAWLHIHCSYCYEQTDWDLAHTLKVEGFLQRQAASQKPNKPKSHPIQKPELAKAVGL